MRPTTCTFAVICALATLAGCGGGSDAQKSATSANAAPKLTGPLAGAASPTKADFPAVGGRSLQQIAETLKAGPQIGLATATFTPGKNRLAFGLLGADNAFLYGKTAVYIARGPEGRASGPFLAPADSLEAAPRFRSKGADDPSEAKAVYSTDVELTRPGRWAVLAMTRMPGGALQGAGTTISVARKTPVPSVGEKPPAVDTETATALAGALDKIDTRDPHDDMHKVSFKNVLGKRPVALLFSTPALCQSRVCGPVTDIAAELEKTYGDRMTFIHQEVYVDNNLNKGLRPQLRAFSLKTEPWLFTVGADGKIAARLEGAFGQRDFRKAIEAAL